MCVSGTNVWLGLSLDPLILSLSLEKGSLNGSHVAGLVGKAEDEL